MPCIQYSIIRNGCASYHWILNSSFMFPLADEGSIFNGLPTKKKKKGSIFNFIGRQVERHSCGSLLLVVLGCCFNLCACLGLSSLVGAGVYDGGG